VASSGDTLVEVSSALLSFPSKYNRHPEDEEEKSEKPYHNPSNKCSFVKVSFEDLAIEWRHGASEFGLGVGVG
jgi:hypothetical protein